MRGVITGRGSLARVLLPAMLTVACGETEPAASRAAVLPAVAAVSAAEAGAGGDPTAQDSAVPCVDTARSVVRWKGTEAVGSGHEGELRLQGGRVRMQDGEVVGGHFTVDMRTIAVTDIPPHEVEARRQLRSHLAHEEFFGVDRFPTARLVLTNVERDERQRYTVSGNLAIRDSVHNVTFEAYAPVVTPEAVRATAAFSFDRYLWGIEFDGRTSALRNALVDDLIQLDLTLVATAAACERAHPGP